MEAADSDTIDGAGRNFCAGTDGNGILRIYDCTFANGDAFFFADRRAISDSYALFSPLAMELLYLGR